MKHTPEGDIRKFAEAFNANQDALHRRARIGAKLAEVVLKYADNLECVQGGPTVVALARQFKAKMG